MRLAFLLSLAFVASAHASGGDAVVLSKAIQADPARAAVASALVERHDARVVASEKDVDQAADRLRATFPRFACFVARPEEAWKGDIRGPEYDCDIVAFRGDPANKAE